MKKSIAFIGALFMGSIAFAQVNKNVNTNKTPSRKVLDTDVKDLPPDPEANNSTGEIKGSIHQKHKGEDSHYLKISDETSSKIKGTSTQKSNASTSNAVDGTETFNEKQPRDYKKPSGFQSATIKSTNLEKTTIKVSGTQGEKSAADPYLKVTSEKKSSVTEKATIKGSGAQNQAASSDIHLKIGEIKGQKDE